MKILIQELMDSNQKMDGGTTVLHMGCILHTYEEEGETLHYKWFDFQDLFTHANFNNQPLIIQKRILAAAKEKLILTKNR